MSKVLYKESDHISFIVMKTIFEFIIWISTNSLPRKMISKEVDVIDFGRSLLDLFSGYFFFHLKLLFLYKHLTFIYVWINVFKESRTRSIYTKLIMFMVTIEWIKQICIVKHEWWDYTRFCSFIKIYFTAWRNET